MDQPTNKKRKRQSSEAQEDPPKIFEIQRIDSKKKNAKKLRDKIKKIQSPILAEIMNLEKKAAEEALEKMEEDPPQQEPPDEKEKPKQKKPRKPYKPRKKTQKKDEDQNSQKVDTQIPLPDETRNSCPPPKFNLAEFQRSKREPEPEDKPMTPQVQEKDEQEEETKNQDEETMVEEQIENQVEDEKIEEETKSEPNEKKIRDKKVEEEKKQDKPKKIKQPKKTKENSEDPKPSSDSSNFTKQERKHLKALKHQKKAQIDDDPEASWQHRCAICFERISERAKPQNCIHTFCMECILGWTKFHNLCPLCKVEIEILEKIDADKVIETIKVEKPAAPAEITDGLDFDNGPQFADFCYICRKNDHEENQIVCEMCDFEIVHFTCLGYKEIPSEEWFCPRCDKEFKKRQEEESKKRQMIKEGKSIFKTPTASKKRLKRLRSSSESSEKEEQDDKPVTRRMSSKRLSKQEEVIKPKKSKKQLEQEEQLSEEETDESDQIQPKAAKIQNQNSGFVKAQNKKKKIVPEQEEQSIPNSYIQAQSIVPQPTGSILNQKLNLQGFKQFGMRLTTAQSGIMPILGKPQPMAPSIAIDQDMFSSYKPVVRPPINPYALNQMHEQAMSLQRQREPMRNKDFMKTMIVQDDSSSAVEIVQTKRPSAPVRPPEQRTVSRSSDQPRPRNESDLTYSRSNTVQEPPPLQIVPQQVPYQPQWQDPPPLHLIPQQIPSQAERQEPPPLQIAPIQAHSHIPQAAEVIPILSQIELSVTNNAAAPKKVTFCSQNESLGGTLTVTENDYSQPCIQQPKVSFQEYKKQFDENLEKLSYHQINKNPGRKVFEIAKEEFGLQVSNEPIQETTETPQKTQYELFLESQKKPMTQAEKKEMKNRKWLEGFKPTVKELPRVEETPKQQQRVAPENRIESRESRQENKEKLNSFFEQCKYQRNQGSTEKTSANSSAVKEPIKQRSAPLRYQKNGQQWTKLYRK